MSMMDVDLLRIDSCIDVMARKLALSEAKVGDFLKTTSSKVCM